MSESQPERPPTVELGAAPLGLADALAIARGTARPEIAPAARRRVAEGHARLRRCIGENRLVYGITTGFGPLADRHVGPGEIPRLQRNLIYHLATGVGPPADWTTARMVALARLSSLLHGLSGASPALVERLLRLLASPYAPRMPLKGTVGASGDLTPLSHLALAMMGEGDFVDVSGAPVAAAAAEAALGGWLGLEHRDGLALVNGTSAMTAVAALNAVEADRLAGAAEALSVGTAELLGGRAEAWDPLLGAVRTHPGQIETHRRLAWLAEGSARLCRARAAETRLDDAVGPAAGAPLQDAYTLRCVPQIIGACRDALRFHEDVTLRELNAVTDNPVFPDDGIPLHGGNFMGQPVAIASDALSAALLSLAGLVERQVARLTDERLNGGLPAFLSRGRPGLESGLMGAQVTASAILAEMRTRAIPASAQSLSTNAANQDVVSMGTIAARNARAHLEDLSLILAILGLAVAQGVEIVGGPDGFSRAARACHRAVRALSGPLEHDRPLAGDIQRVADRFRRSHIFDDGPAFAVAP